MTNEAFFTSPESQTETPNVPFETPTPVEVFTQTDVIEPEDDLFDLNKEEPKKETIDDTILRDLVVETIQSENKTLNDERDGEQRICIPLSDFKAITDASLEDMKKIGIDEWRKNLQDTTKVPGIINEVYRFFNAQTELMKEALEDIKNKNGEVVDLQSKLVNNIDGIVDAIAKQPPAPKDKHISSKKSRTRALALIQGIKRVVLWNSGIYLSVRAPKLSELATFFNSVKLDRFEYGRTLGAHFYMFQDMLIKQTMLKKILPYVIVDCSLRNYENLGEDIIRYISIHDYDTILWALIVLMFKNGLPVNYYCAENLPGQKEEVKCKHIDTKLLDPTKLRFLNLDLINEAMKSFIASKEKVNPLEVKEFFKNHVKYPDDVFRFEHETIGGTVSYWEIHFRVPNCEEYISYGNDVQIEMMELLDTDLKDISLEDYAEYVSFNFYKLFIPWVDRIIQRAGPEEDSEIITDMYNNPDSKEDRVMVRDILDIFQTEKINIQEPLIKFIKGSKITHIAYQYDTCPNCHNKPSNAVNGFIPFDVHTCFFNLGYIRLTAKK